MFAGFGSFLVLKMIISYLIVMIIVLNMKVFFLFFFFGKKKVKVFQRTWNFFFYKNVLNVILTFEFGKKKKRVEEWRLVIIVKWMKN